MQDSHRLTPGELRCTLPLAAQMISFMTADGSSRRLRARAGQARNIPGAACANLGKSQRARGHLRRILCAPGRIIS
jgi:hypothetical protein